MTHSHHHHHHAHSASRGIGTAFFLNLGFTLIELVGGALTNSIAIISDAVHDFGDSISLAMAWYFQRLSGRGSAKGYSYGYRRFSLLGAIVNSVVLLVGSAYILTEAIPRIFAPQPANAEGMIALAAAGIVINGIAALRTRRGRSINERVVSLHLLEDVLGWAAVLAGAVIMYFTGLAIIDPILSVLIAVFIIFNVVKNIRQTIPIIMQGVPLDIESGSILASLRRLDGIAGVHDLHIWSLDEEYNVLTAHVALVRPLSAAEQASLKAQIRELLAQQNIQHSTIEFEQAGEECAFAHCAEGGAGE